MTCGEAPRRHGWTQLGKLVRLDPGRGPGADFERMCVHQMLFLPKVKTRGSEQAVLRHRQLKIRSKSVPGPLPGSKRTSFPRRVQPWRRGGPPRAKKPRTPILEARTSKVDLKPKAHAKTDGYCELYSRAARYRSPSAHFICITGNHNHSIGGL